MEIIMTNGQMGIPSLEKNRISSLKCCPVPSSLHRLLVSQKPIFGIALNTKKVNHIRIFTVRTPNCRTANALSKEESENSHLINNGRFLEKEFKFQPLFDDYLKAMESVRTGREKNPIQDSNGYRSRKSSTVENLSRAPVLETDEENEKLSLEGHSYQVKSTDSMEMDGSSEKSSLGIGREGSGRGKLGLKERGNRILKDRGKWDLCEGFSEKGGVGSTWGSGWRKLEYRESNIDLKDERGVGVDGDMSLERINGRCMNDQACSVEQKMGGSKFSKSAEDRKVHGSYGKVNAVKNIRSNVGVGGLGQNGKSTEMQKKQLFRKGLWVKSRVSNVEGTTDLSCIPKSMPERMKFNRSNDERKPGGHQTVTDRKEFYRSDIEGKLGETESSEGMYEKVLFRRSKVEKKMGDTEITNSRERSYGNQSHVKLNENAFEMETLGPRITRTHEGWNADCIKAEKETRYKISLKSGNFTKGNKVFMEDVDENDLEMERAAFKSFEVFNDVRDMPRVSRMEMEERIQKLAKWLNGTDINLPEWLFSKMMRSAKIRYTDHSILRIIQILGTLGNWRRVLQVIEWLQSRERFKSHKSRYIYTAALDVLGKAKRPVEALNVFHAMLQERSSYPDLAAYHCIAITLGQAGHMNELFDVIDCLRSPPKKKFKAGGFEKWDPQMEPDVVIYNAVLNACVRRKQWEGAFWVLQQLKQQGIQPSSTTYGLVMEVMFACAKYDLVHEFFRKVEKSSVPNSLNYRVLVNTLWREGKTDEAVLAVQDMERRGIVGSASLYYDLARCLSSAGRCQEALMQIDKICKVATKPLVVTYTGLIQACLDSGSVHNGAYIFEQMRKFCSPNLVTCNIMLKAYLEHGMFEEAKDLFQKMSGNSNHISSRADYKDRVIPDNYTFNTMLDACIAEKKWDDFEYVYQQMLHHGYHFNAKHHLQMIMQACRAGKGELLETTWKNLVQANRIPPPPIIKERFCMKLEEDDYAEAISTISCHHTNQLHAFSEKVWLDLFKAKANRFQKDTLVRLVHELSTLIAGSHRSHPIFQNVITSCREFISTHLTAAEINPIENGNTV